MAEDDAREMLEPQRSKYFGKYRGLVKDNDESSQGFKPRGRLLVSVPQVLGADTEVWAMPCVPYAGKNVGLFALPPTGTVVWVEFEAGDPSYPIWTGCVWALGDIDATDAKPDIKFFRTEKFKLRIDDSASEALIEIQDGSQILISSTEITIKSSQTITNDASGKKTVLSGASFAVDNGALEVQ
jgi:uncharacterized protein involved in type VI secretion and phage assembly